MSDAIDREFNGESGATATPTPLGRTMALLRNDRQLQGCFKFNIFTGDTEHAQDNIILAHTAKASTALTDTDFSCLRTYITQQYNFSPSRVNLDDAVVRVAMDNSYHPIKEYLEKLKWDGVPRLDRWLVEICGADDNEYTRAVGRKLLIAAVQRIYEPGCWWAQLVILEGRQRIYKSRLVEKIGQKWYASVHLKTQDVKTIVEEMRGKWILEIEELAGFGKQETEYMKAFVSRTTDRVRLSYGQRAADYPRQSIMIATMNPDLGENKYLNDVTGNVRYWPVRCGEGKLKVDVFEDVRDQLFAEAMAAYDKKESLWLQGVEEEQLAEAEQEKRLQEDPWGAIISLWLHGQTGREKVTANEVAKDCLGISHDKANSGMYRRISRALVQCGWIKKKSTMVVKIDEKNIRPIYYFAPESSEKPEVKGWDE